MKEESKKSFSLTMEEVAQIVHRHLKATEQVLSLEVEKEFTYMLDNLEAPKAEFVELRIEYTLKPNAGHRR